MKERVRKAEADEAGGRVRRVNRETEEEEEVIRRKKGECKTKINTETKRDRECAKQTVQTSLSGG